MSIKSKIAEYKRFRGGVCHCTFNPGGPGVVRIHLVPPKFKLFGSAPYVVILNGYYVLPIGPSYAAILAEFISEVNALVNSMGYTRIQRVQFISDGAAWLENLARQVFTDGKVLRVIDFYHACEYLGLVVKELSGDATWKEDFAKLKKLMKEKGGRAALAELERMFGASSVAGIGGDAAKALAYIRNRLQYMEYGAYRADGYYIGSGTVESACKSVVAARCKLAGMHWRLATVDAITLLRATLRSRLAIAA